MISNKLFVTFLAAVLLAGACLFYWYSWRPSQIIKKCAGERYEYMSYEESYKTCVRGGGLEK